MKTLSLLFCLLGTILHCSLLIPWLLKNGLDLSLLFQQAAASKLSLFAWSNLLLTSMIVLVLAIRKLRLGMHRYGFVVLATLCLGSSLGLPLYLYFFFSGNQQRDPVAQASFRTPS